MPTSGHPKHGQDLLSWFNIIYSVTVPNDLTGDKKRVSQKQFFPNFIRVNGGVLR